EIRRAADQKTGSGGAADVGSVQQGCKGGPGRNLQVIEKRDDCGEGGGVTGGQAGAEKEPVGGRRQGSDAPSKMETPIPAAALPPALFSAPACPPVTPPPSPQSSLFSITCKFRPGPPLHPCCTLPTSAAPPDPVF